MVGQDLDLVNENNEKIENLKLAYLAIDEEDNVIDISYDPITGYGASFYDLISNNNSIDNDSPYESDGIADTINLTIEDGGFGDKDGIKNGIIVDPSTAGYSILSNEFTGDIGTNSIKYSDLTNPSATANSNLVAILDQSTLTSSSDEIGYVALNEGETFAELTYEEFIERYRVLYHTLENNDVIYGSEEAKADLFKREILVGNDQSLIFYKITDGSTNSLTSLDDSRLSLLNINSISEDSAKLTSSDNLTVDLTATNSEFGIEQYICKEQSRAPIFDFRNLENFQITGTVEISREANYDTTLGFYKILDTEGTVLDPITNELITTSHAEYDSYALSDDNKVSFGSNHPESTFYVEDDSTTSFDITIEDFELIAPYATVIGEGGIERTYFAFDGVNSARHGSNMSHFKVFGDNTLGIEDTIGGGDNDFDDLILHLSIDNVI